MMVRVPFEPAGTKQDAIDRLNALLGTRAALGRGSSIPEELFAAANALFGLLNEGGMPARAQALVESAGLAWDAGFDSRSTPSGGGSTVTLAGMNRFLQAIESVAGDSLEAEIGRLGRRYSPSTSEVTAPPRALLRDWSALDAATKAHARLEALLAAQVTAAGLAPMSAGPSDPAFDLAWTRGSTLVVVEVKSITATNHRQQVRLGLGQVIEYRTVLAARGFEVQGALAIASVASRVDLAMAKSADVVLVDESTDHDLARLKLL